MHGCHHSHHCGYPYGWTEPYPPYHGCYAFSPREEDLRRREEERNLLERRLRRMEEELQELRKGTRPGQE